MSFGEHLEELRRRLLLALIVPVPISIIVFFASDILIRWLVLPLTAVLESAGLPPVVQTLSPPEMLITKLKLSIIGAIVISGPWILWQAWQFIAPGLYRTERRFIYLLGPGSAVLTVLGVALMYWVMLPLMLLVLVMVSTNLDLAPERPAPDPRAIAVLEQQPALTILFEAPDAPSPGTSWLLWPDLELRVAVADAEAVGGVAIINVPHWPTTSVEQRYRVSDYIGFVLLLLLGIVIAFQLPLVLMLMGWLGLASPHWLRSQRKYALLVGALVCAVITPPDALSMIMMLVPLYALFELGILLMAILPIRVVLDGPSWRFGRSARGPDNRAADKRSSPIDQTRKTVQTDGTIPRRGGSEQSRPGAADGEGGAGS